MASEAPAKPGSGEGEDDKPAASAANAVLKTADREPGDPSPAAKADRASATDWFLSSDEQEQAWAWVPVNVAGAGKPEQIVDFKVQVVDRDKIRELRRASERKNADGISEVDEMEANLQIVVEGLIEPNLRTDEQFRTVRGQYFPDPAEALRARFAYKPGLIDQIAGKVVEISGYNDKDVKEVKAAGN